MNERFRSVLRRIHLQALGLHQRTALARSGRHSFRIALNSHMDWSRARTLATKEPDTIAWIEQYCRPGDTFYDVGANIGVFSLLAARHVEPGGIVHAFEPEALNFAQLNKNVALNQLAATIHTHCLAISDRQGLDSLYFHPRHLVSAAGSPVLSSGTALHAIGSPTDHAGSAFQAAHRQGTFSVTIDALGDDHGLAFPNHIKIDVDGGEKRIIKGAARTLRDARLRSILVESADPSFVTTLESDLTRLGFARIRPAVAVEGRVFANVIFAR